MCTIPKNGCTQWKRLILKARLKDVSTQMSRVFLASYSRCQGPSHGASLLLQAMGKPPWFYLDEKTSHLTIHGTRYRYLNRIPRAKMLDALEDENTARFVIARNPFTRVLSSYLNKIVKANDRRRYREKLGLDQWSDWVTFKDYIAALRKWKAEHSEGLRLSSTIDHHFALQSRYPCIVDKLNISSLVDSGWPDEHKCFFNAPGRPCDGQSMKGGFSHNSWDARDHATSASSRLREHYDEESERQVAELYKEDFEYFGYNKRLSQSTKSDLGFEYQPGSAENEHQPKEQL
eukprot:scaffold176689_cov39-Prasinocladus_malaysianus.AAC.1